MSASNQKKLRQKEREVYRSERERQDALEAQKLRKQTIAFVLVIALCLSIFLGSLLVSPFKNVLYKNTLAITVGDHELTSVDVNYFYIDAINNMINQYYIYFAYGIYTMDFSKPLDEQAVDSRISSAGGTWADYFLTEAVKSIKSTYGLYDLAMKNDHKLTEDEQKELDGLEATMKENAKKGSYKSVKEMLQTTYGNGAALESYLEYYKICTYATSYYNAYEDSLKYDSETLREYEGEEGYKYNSYTFAHSLIESKWFLPDGVTEAKATAEQKKAAQEAAKELADRLAAGDFLTVEEFDIAVDEAIKEAKGENKTDDKDNGTSTQAEEEIPEEEIPEEETPEDGEETEDPEEEKKPDLKYPSTKQDKILFSSINTLFQDWIIGKLEADADDKDADKDEDDKAKFEERHEGDMTVIEYSTGTGDKKEVKGFYVLRFEECLDNSYALANIRHLLIKFKGGKTNSTTGQTTYTEAEKNAAKAQAEKLYAEFKAGTISEDAFSALAQIHSEDSNKAEGGLYEDVYPGQMVTSFNDWCFDEARKPGDHGLVETEYGWHLMFYCSDSETTYRDYMASNDKRAEDMKEWYEDIIKNSEYEELNMKHVPMDKVLSY